MKMKVVVVASNKAAVALAAVLAMLLMLPPSAVLAMLPLAGGGTGLGSNCTRSCGNISIPYPFGIETGCYNNDTGFNLTCKHSKLFLGDGLQVLDISIPKATVLISVSPNLICHNSSIGTWGIALAQHRSYPYSLSDSYNMISRESDNRPTTPNELVSLTAISPLINIYIAADGYTFDYHVYNIHIGYSFYNIQIRRLRTQMLPFNFSCDIFDPDNLACNRPDSVNDEQLLPVMLSWVIAKDSCATPDAKGFPYPGRVQCLGTNRSCRLVLPSSFSVSDDGYTCQCSQGYQGNPYVANGPDACQILMSAVLHRGTLAMVNARIRPEVFFATALLAIKATLLSQMDAKTLMSASTRKHTRATGYAKISREVFTANVLKEALEIIP